MWLLRLQQYPLPLLIVLLVYRPKGPLRSLVDSSEGGTEAVVLVGSLGHDMSIGTSNPC